MTEDGPEQTATTLPQHPHLPRPAAPAEPAEEMDLSDAPKAPPWAGSDSDEEREQGGDRGGDTDRAPA